MSWEKVSAYCIKQAGYFISRTGIKGSEGERFTLFNGNDTIEIFKTADEAKAKFEDLQK